MPGDGRTEEDILREIASEREQLAGALADLREGIEAKRRPAAVIGATLAAGITAAVALKVVRRLGPARRA